MASMFSQMFGRHPHSTELAEIEQGPNRAERRAAAKKAAAAKRRGQRAYQRAVIAAEARRYAAEKAEHDMAVDEAS